LYFQCLIQGCRKIEDGKAAEAKIRNQGITTGSVIVLELDLMSLDSVRRFADNILNNTTSVSILVNNGKKQALGKYLIQKPTLDNVKPNTKNELIMKSNFYKVYL